MSQIQAVAGGFTHALYHCCYLSPLLRSSQVYRAIGWAGLLAGSLDITAAFVEAGLEGRGPVCSPPGHRWGTVRNVFFSRRTGDCSAGNVFSFSNCHYGCGSFLLGKPQVEILGKARPPIGTALRSCGLHLYVLHRAPPLRLSHENCASNNGGTYQGCRRTHVHGRVADLLMVRKYSA